MKQVILSDRWNARARPPARPGQRRVRTSIWRRRDGGRRGRCGALRHCVGGSASARRRRRRKGGREGGAVFGATLHNLEDRCFVVIAAANVRVLLGEIESGKSSSPCPAQTNSIITHLFSAWLWHNGTSIMDGFTPLRERHATCLLACCPKRMVKRVLTRGRTAAAVFTLPRPGSVLPWQKDRGVERAD